MAAVRSKAKPKHAVVEEAPVVVELTGDELLIAEQPHSPQNPIVRAIVSFHDDADANVKALFV